MQKDNVDENDTVVSMLVEIASPISDPEKIKQIVSNAISYYLEEGVNRESDEEKLNFALSVDILSEEEVRSLYDEVED